MKISMSKTVMGLLMFFLLAWMAAAADVSGIWTGKITDPDGDRHELTLSLKMAGDNLVGSVSGDPPGGNLKKEQQIANGKVDGDQLSWETSVSEPDGDTFSFKYQAKVNGNQMEGTIILPGKKEATFTATKK